jgi:hypothetical protein
VRVHAARLLGGLLVLVGRSADGAESESFVCVHDPRTLEPIAQFKTISETPVRWAFGTALGEIFLGTDTAIERWAIDSSGTPRPMLVTTNSQTGASSSPMLVGANLLFATANDVPAVLPLFGGDVRFLEIPAAEDVNRTIRGMIPVPEGVVVQFNDRAILVGPTGEVRGADASNRTRNSPFALPVAAGLLRCDTSVINDAADDPGARGGDYGLVVQLLSTERGLRVEGKPFAFRTGVETVGRATVFEGWLLISTKSRVVGIPMPLSGAGKADGGAPETAPGGG